MINFILEELARLFGYPCKIRECEHTLHERDIEWCEKNCGAAKAKECWKHYFKIKQKENQQNGNS